MANKLAGIIAAVALIATVYHVDSAPMSANMRLSTLCSSTTYPAKCEKSLTPFLNDADALVLEEVVQAALQVAMDEVAAAYADVGKGSAGAADSVSKSAMVECKKLLEDAMMDLEDMVGLQQLQTVSHVNDLRMWLSGVMTYIYTCPDGFDEPELKEAMEQLLQSSTELSSNALAIVTGVGELLQTEVGSTSRRRLLASSGGRLDEETDDHRVLFPGWVSSHDRRLLQQQGLPSPDVVVAADGSGDFTTIAEAVSSAPNNKKSTGARFVIYVKAGDYREYVTIPKNKPNIFMYGDGPNETRVIGDRSNKKGGFSTTATATFSAKGSGFICRSMGFANTAGPEGHQAVALHVQGDMSVFFGCRFEGYQDTLYVHANRQFFRDCEVLGTVDFIFGNSAALLQNCLITVRRPMHGQSNMVTAQGRTDPGMPTGIVLQGCTIAPERALFPARLQVATYLGRPWKQYARTVVMESAIGDFIRPEGWSEWKGDLGLDTLYYAEYNNTGPGADTANRVAWPGYHVIGRAEATWFTPAVFIDGMNWLNDTGTPCIMGFIK